MQINYVWQSADDQKVYMDGKVVGTIKRITVGSGWVWQYFPKGSKTGGEQFKSLAECHRSLEG